MRYPATLTEFAANPRWLGGVPAFSLVLHTWKQDLGRHVHLHALVAGGVLTEAGVWIRPRRAFCSRSRALSKGISWQVRRGSGGLANRRAIAGIGRDECRLAVRSARCMPTTGWSMPKSRWAAPRRCWTIWAAIRTGWRSRMSGSSVSTRARCPSGCAPTDPPASARSTSRVRVHWALSAPCPAPRVQAYPALRSACPGPKEERAGRCSCRARCAATTTQSHRVGGRVPAPGGAHRTGALSALRYRTVSRVGGALA
ncbi:MAG: transposase [Propionivibrio sp.]|nr:transposase [Propionivibrio sp.]